MPPNDEFFEPALAYLTTRKDARWVRGAWFAHKGLPFFGAMTADEAKLMLDNLLAVPRIEHQVERILIQIARKHLSLVWEYFGHRSKGKTEGEGPDWYEAFPYHLHGLEKELGKDVTLAISTVRGWYEEDSKLVRFGGGRLLSIVFPTFQEDFAIALGDLVNIGTSEDADFTLAVMENYHGELTTHEVLKRIVAKYPNDRTKLAGLVLALIAPAWSVASSDTLKLSGQKKRQLHLGFPIRGSKFELLPKIISVVSINVLRTHNTALRSERLLGGLNMMTMMMAKTMAAPTIECESHLLT